MFYRSIKNEKHLFLSSCPTHEVLKDSRTYVILCNPYHMTVDGYAMNIPRDTFLTKFLQPILMKLQLFLKGRHGILQLNCCQVLWVQRIYNVPQLKFEMEICLPRLNEGDLFWIKNWMCIQVHIGIVCHGPDSTTLHSSTAVTMRWKAPRMPRRDAGQLQEQWDGASP